MINFTFIQVDFPQLYTDAIEAEKLVFVSPTSTALFCRSTFENGVNWLYDHDAKLIRPWRSDLSTLMHEPAFTGLFNLTFFLNLI